MHMDSKSISVWPFYCGFQPIPPDWLQWRHKCNACVLELQPQTYVHLVEQVFFVLFFWSEVFYSWRKV